LYNRVERAWGGQGSLRRRQGKEYVDEELVSVFTRLPCPCRQPQAEISACYDQFRASATLRLILREGDVGELDEPADAVLHVAELLHPRIVDALGVTFGDLTVGEDGCFAEVRSYVLVVEHGFTLSGPGVIGVPVDVLDGLRVDDPVFLPVTVARLPTAAHQDVHAIVSGHDILPFGLAPASPGTQSIHKLCELVEYPALYSVKVLRSNCLPAEVGIFYYKNIYKSIGRGDRT